MSEKINCNVCNIPVNKKYFTTHLFKQHRMKPEEYFIKYNTWHSKCLCCGKPIFTRSKKYCDSVCTNIYKTNLKYKNTDNIPCCKFCGIKLLTLTKHLKNTHNISKEDYINKFNLKEEDVVHFSVIKEMSERIKGSKNPAYKHNGRLSPFSKSFIKYDNLSELEKEKTINSFKIAIERLPENNSCKIEYYLKKTDGDLEEAKKLLSERQSTFSLDKCIKKYGEIEGPIKWKERQDKWISNFKKQNYSIVSQELFWILYNKIKNNYKHIYFATLNKNKEYEITKTNYEYKLETKNSYVKPDFYILDNNKIIEFDGDYWHGKKEGNKKREILREKNIKDKNPEIKIYHVKEKDFKLNPQKVIKECIDFINE